MIDNKKKGDCQCRSCKKVFNYNELNIKEVEHYGIYINENVCPYCGSSNYGSIDYPICEEELIYKNGKFFKHSGKDIAKRIDRIINEMTYNNDEYETGILVLKGEWFMEINISEIVNNKINS